MEELWTELLKAWPAVKNNPEIAEKIEKLWNILKTSGNDHLKISKEIQNLISNNNRDAGFTPGSATNSSQTESSNINPVETTTTSRRTTAQDDDIDSLLADILGDDYKQETNFSSNQTNIDDNKTKTTGSSSSSSSSSAAEELDKLVASILGEDWLKEESSISPSYDNQITKTEQNIGTSKSKHSIFESEPDIDDLVSSIISSDSNENIISPAIDKVPSENKQLISDKQDIDELLNEILNEDDSNEKLTKDNKKPEENIDELINKEISFVSTTSSLSNVANEERNQITNSNHEENIDDLINEALNKNSDFTNTTSSLSSDEEITTDEKSKENIDDLINEILNKESVLTDTTSSLSSNEEITTDEKPEENIDDLINEILNDKTDTNSISDELNIEEIHIQANKDNSSHQADDSQIFKKVIASQTSRKTEPTSYKQPEKQGSNTLIIIILIILLLGIIGIWKLFFNNEEMTTQIATTEKQHTDIVSSSEEVTTVIEEAAAEKDTLQTIKEYQYKTEPEYSPPAMEKITDTNETAYSALIEQDENDITITLNSPETAIESNDSTIFNTNEAISPVEAEPLADSNINTLESITEKANQKKPVKTVAKRKVIIHKIVKGDTLWAIAKRYVNNPYRYPELAKLSKIKNPNRIYPGNKVKIIIYIK